MKGLNRHREHDRRTQRDKRDKEQASIGGEKTNCDGQWERDSEKEKNTEEQKKERRDS